MVCGSKATARSSPVASRTSAASLARSRLDGNPSRPDGRRARAHEPSPRPAAQVLYVADHQRRVDQLKSSAPKGQRTGVGANPWPCSASQHRHRQVNADNRRAGGCENRKIAAGSGAHIERARRNDSADHALDNGLLALHQWVVGRRRVGIGPQLVRRLRLQQRCHGQNPVVSGR
jgi:hypothetical protein